MKRWMSGAGLMGMHFAADIAMGGGHLFIDAAIAIAVALGLVSWAKRKFGPKCCVAGHTH